MAHILNREALRVITKNERGVVNYRKRYKKGDEVDVSKMDEARVAHFISNGTLVHSTDDLSESPGAGSVAPTSPPYGAATGDSGQATGTGEDTPEGYNPDDHTEPVDPSDGGVEDVDQYSAMDYSDLQEAAKGRDLRYVGVSADDLRQSLRADDES